MKSRNAAVQLMLAELRDELLAPPSEARALDHVAMMQLEKQLLDSGTRAVARPASRQSAAARPRFALRAHARVRRVTWTRSRRIAAVFAAMFVFFGNVGPNAAGAFPAAVRSITDHVTDTIVDTFGVPQSHDRSAGPGARGGSASIDGSQRTSTSPGSRTGESDSLSPITDPSTTTSPGDAGGSTTPPSDPGNPAGGPTTTVPPVGIKLPPQNNMDRDPDTPPGLPSDWRERALAAALARLQTCAQASELAPTGCPQIADLGGATPDSLHWSLLNQPLAGAAIVPRPADDGYGSTQVGAEISVFGLFQMNATYTVAGDPRLHYAYSSGVAEARMTWSGSAVENVRFVSGSVANQLPPDVQMPQFERPADVLDIAVLIALQQELDAWATPAGGTLVGDPLATASVTFDAVHGTFAVAGTYTTTAAGSTEPVTNPFTASLVYDGQNLLVLSISGS
jgi:hypothetical protein